MARRSRLTIAIIAIAIAVAACGGDDDPAVEVEPPATEPGDDLEDTDETMDDPDGPSPPDEVELPSDEARDDEARDDESGKGTELPERLDPDLPADERRPDASGVLGDEIRIAVEDAARRTGADAAEVTVVAAEKVTWPDGAIGCPEPGQMYTMALVEGYRIVLEVDGAELAYHGAGDSPPAYCADPVPPADTGGRVTR